MGEVIAGQIGIIVGAVVLLYAYMVYRGMNALPDGNDKMRRSPRRFTRGPWCF